MQLGSGSFNIHGSLTLEFASYDVSQNPGKYFGSPTAQGTTFEIANIDGGVTAFGWDFASIGASISNSEQLCLFLRVCLGRLLLLLDQCSAVTINLGAISPLPFTTAACVGHVAPALRPRLMAKLSALARCC